MAKLTHIGKFTKGYYNDMEAGYPVFIDGDSLSDIVKDLLREHGYNANFCDEQGEMFACSEKASENKLIGKQVTLTLEFEETDNGQNTT